MMTDSATMSVLAGLSSMQLDVQNDDAPAHDIDAHSSQFCGFVGLRGPVENRVMAEREVFSS